MSNDTTPPSNSPNSLGGVSSGRLAELMEGLRALLAQEMSIVQQRWQRTLPFADYVVDRWQKAKALGFGEGSSIYDSALVLGDVKVGKNTWIGPFTVLDGSGGLTIGDNCSISAGVQIYTHDTVDWAVSGGQAKAAHAPTAIGDNCYIGPNTVVAKGVCISSGCIIGANSLVLRDIPGGSTAFGSPCRVTGCASAQPNPLPSDRGTASS